MDEAREQTYQRKLKRHQLSSVVEIYDRVSGQHIGRLVNIHAEGLMIVGATPLQDDKLYQLELRLPEEINARTTISIGVDCLWTRSAEQDKMHWTGGRIIDASDEALADIAALIELLGE